MKLKLKLKRVNTNIYINQKELTSDLEDLEKKFKRSFKEEYSLSPHKITFTYSPWECTKFYVTVDLTNFKNKTEIFTIERKKQHEYMIANVVMKFYTFINYSCSIERVTLKLTSGKWEYWKKKKNIYVFAYSRDEN